MGFTKKASNKINYRHRNERMKMGGGEVMKYITLYLV
jgi:hypothetical protein